MIKAALTVGSRHKLGFAGRRSLGLSTLALRAKADAMAWKPLPADMPFPDGYKRWNGRTTVGRRVQYRRLMVRQHSAGTDIDDADTR